MDFEDILNQKKSVKTDEFSSCLIYFLLNKDKIVYVGQSKRGMLRIFDHVCNNNAAKKNFDSYAIKPCTEEEMQDAEAFYIMKFKPVYNKIFPNSDKYVNLRYILSKGDVEKFMKEGYDYIEFKPAVYASTSDFDDFYNKLTTRG